MPQLMRTVKPGDAPAPAVMTPEIAKAMAAFDAAQDAVDKQHGVVEVARARLAEAEAAAPPISTRLRDAEQAVVVAREKAERASERVAAALRALADCASDVEAAEAVLQDLQDRLDGSKPATNGDLVTARMAVEKAQRAASAAGDALVARREAKATAENELAAAEQARDEALAGPAVTPVSVVAARVEVANAERALARSERAAETARAEYARVSREATTQADSMTPHFANLEEFVECYLLPNWRHKMSPDTHWCSYWWRHSEAVTRLGALWQAFEVMRLQPAPSLSTFWRDHVDVHMAALTRETGTFAGCASTRTGGREDNHTQQEQWHHQPAPAGLFDDLTGNNEPEGATA